MPLTKTCQQCGETFAKPVSLSRANWPGRRYCTLDCYRASVDHPRHCPVCGERFRQRFGGQATCGKKACQDEHRRTVTGPAAAERMRAEYASGRRVPGPGISPRERRLWPLLAKHGWFWRLRWAEAAGDFELDFAHSARMLNVELDGIEHRQARGLKRDQLRDAALEERGWRILRIPNADVDADPQAVAQRILAWAV